MADIFYSTLQPDGPQAEGPAGGLLRSFLADMEARKRAKTTIDSYRLAVQHYLRYLADCSLNPRSVSKQNIVEFLSTLDGKPSTRYQATVAIRMFHHFLFRTGARPDNPACELAAQLVPPPSRKVLSLAQVQSLLNASISGPRKKFRMLRDRVMLLLLYATGIRPAELCGLKEVDIDWGHRTIMVRGKGNRMRSVSFPAPLEPLLRDYIEIKMRLFGLRHWLMLSFRGKRMRRGSVWLEVKRMAKAAGLREIVSPVILRHTFATHLMWGGADLRSIQSLLGHRDLRTTAIYTQLDEGHVQRTYDQTHPLANGQIQEPGDGG
ncbi:MAG: tyrosine-type recombinase/integrase [Elusimicrobiota bacterium]